MFKHMFKDKYNNKVKNITIPSTTMEWIDTLILLLFFFNIYIYIYVIIIIIIIITMNYQIE